MEATIEMDNVIESTPSPSFTKKYWVLIVGTLLFLLVILGALVIDYCISGSANPPSKSQLFEWHAAAFLLVLVGFGGIMYYVIGKLKKSDEKLEDQAFEIKSTRTELTQTSAQLETTKSDLDYANNQLSNTLFQLNNANLQFDIITGELDAAKRETDTIFANVRQGLFLLSPDGTIGAQTSEELKQIFQASDLSRRTFVTLLRPLLPEKRHKTISDFLELLFDPRKNDKQLQRFNPLKRVELNFPNPEGGFKPKHVEFSFQRIINANTVVRVMVTALDITERVKLEEQLRQGEVLREKQLELLFEILQVESAQLRRFIDTADGVIVQTNGIFMEAGPNAEGGTPLADKVQRVFRLAHSLKSQAAALGLLLFEKTIHQIEDQLNDLRRNPNLVNEDLLNVLVSIANFQAQLKEASGLIEKISGLRRSFGGGESTEGSDREGIGIAPLLKPSVELKKTVEDLSKTIMSRRGKQVRLEWKVETYDDLPTKHRKVLQNAIFQLVRNSIVHGVELPEERQRVGKEPCGVISVTLMRIPGEKKVQLVCRDDGAGLDADKIRKRAVKEGLLKEAESNTLSDNELCTLIFEPGFSTAGAVTEDAGRGVGLDVVRDEVVGELGGEIQIEFSTSRFCEFGIVLPMP